MEPIVGLAPRSLRIHIAHLSWLSSMPTCERHFVGRRADLASLHASGLSNREVAPSSC